MSPQIAKAKMQVYVAELGAVYAGLEELLIKDTFRGITKRLVRLRLQGEVWLGKDQVSTGKDQLVIHARLIMQGNTFLASISELWRCRLLKAPFLKTQIPVWDVYIAPRTQGKVGTTVAYSTSGLASVYLWAY